MDKEFKEILGKLALFKSKAVLTSDDITKIAALEERQVYCYEHGTNTKVSQTLSPPLPTRIPIQIDGFVGFSGQNSLTLILFIIDC